MFDYIPQVLAELAAPLQSNRALNVSDARSLSRQLQPR